MKFDKIFWTENVCVCVLSVSLNEQQLQCYLMTEESVPHLFVSNVIKQQWKDLGFFFVKKCLQATDWVEVDKDIAQSKSVGAFKSNCDFDVQVLRTVLL